MNLSRLSRRRVGFAVALIVFFVLFALSVLSALAQHNPLEEMKSRVAAAGSYRFVADVEQTLVPRPLPEMIGQTSQRVDVRLEGEIALPERAHLQMRLEGGGLDESPVSLVQSGEQIFAQVDGELQPIDNPYALATPGNDFLQYLDGAEGLQPAEGDGHFTFAVSGQRLARAVRDRMQSALEKSGQLPPGVQVTSSSVMANVSGQGELWLNEEGLPRRLALDLEQPGVSPEYDARAHIVVDFADYGQVDSLPQPVQNEDGTWRVEQQPVAGGQLSNGGLSAFFQATVQPSNLLLLLVCFGVVATIRLYRRHGRQVYAVVVILVILSFVTTPLLQSWRTVRFFERYAFADEQPVADHQSPDASGQPAPLPLPDASPLKIQPGLRAAEGTAAEQKTTCGDGDPSVDTDGDDLNDRDENCLGTDPGHEDSDRDTITDTLELDGFEFPAASGQMWYGDPLKADSNEDGLLDSYEWPDPYGSAPEWDTDGDGIPAPWDDDNDGDGVPDSLDLAPYAYSDYGDSFSLSTQGGGFDGYEFIEIQVQPQDAAHLRYSLSALDWPYDNKGQVRDLNSSREDVRLVPILQITANTAPDKEMAADYGVSMVENDDGTYTLYAALAPLDNGGQITAFAAKVAYEPEKLDDIRWTEARLVWIAQMQNDTWKFRNPGWQIVTQSTPLVTYTDSFRVTGLQVSKGKDFESAILGTPALPNDDRDLFQAALAAGSTFMSYQTPTLADVADRFHNADPNADPLYTWGLHPADVDEDMPQTYTNRDEGLADTNQRAFDFLGTQGYAHSSNPSLLTLMEEDIGAWNMGEVGSGQIAAQFNVDLDNLSLTTQRSAKLTTYDYQDDAWQPLAIEDTLHLMQERYDTSSLEPVRAGLETDYPDLTTADLQTTVLMFYTAWLNGRNKVSQVDADQLLDPAPADLDQQTYDDVHLPQSKYDNLSAYLLEAAELAEPGGGFRLGRAPAQAWDYQHAHGPTVDAFSMSPLDFSVFYAHLQNLPDVPLPRWEMLTAINVVKFAFAAYTYRQLSQLMKAGEIATPLSMDKLCNHKLGAIAVGVTLLIIWITFAAGTDFSNPFVWKTALAYALAATIFTLLTFAMSFFPGFAIWLAIFVLVDLIVLLATWGRVSITGKAIEWLSKAFYEVRLLTSFEDMDFKNAQGALKNENIGIVSGNSYVISQTFEGTIEHTKHADDDDIDDSTAYAWFEVSSSQASPASERGSTTCRTSDEETVCTNEARAEFYFDQAHRNIRLETDTCVHTRTYYEECKLWGESCNRSEVVLDLPEDLREDQRRQWTGSEIYIDVLPNTVGGLWTWDEISAPDHDGDRLSNAYEADLGTDPDLWDTDGDGLDDKFEVDNREDLGCDPLVADTDGDGLSDSLEYRLKTGIDQPDSDDDGLLDGEEVFHQDLFDTDGDSDTTEWLGGWLVDDLPETAQTYWLFSDPTQADADDDGLDDKAERAYHTSPNAYNEAPRLELTADPLAVAPDGDEAVYLEPGDTVILDLSLDSVGPDPISAVVTLCLPDFLTNLQDGQMSGDRTPARQDAAGCNGFEWDFSGANTLQNWESVTTTVTAVAANVASARGEAVASFPYQVGDETQDIESRVAVVLDNEDPSVSISAPEDGELIGGGVSDYVVGGNAGDETAWVDHVSLQLPGAGTVTAEGENPWAYTWNLPADGIYDLTATAYDYLGHASAADSVQVTVDNTAPKTTLDLADGATVSAEASGVITIPLSGTASDNLTGLTRVQISLDGRPWREVWTSETYPLNASWTAEWTLPNEDSASGEHVVMVRALDRAGNYSEPLERTIVVDVLPPTDELGNRIYQADPPHLPTGQQVDLYGVANDAGNAPAPSRPEELLGSLDGLFDATIWLGLPTVFDNDDGVQLAWLGDFNNDRLADLALGLPAAEDDNGRVVVVYGRAGDWPAPDDVEPVADSRTSFVGQRGPSSGGGLGATLSTAGDVNGDGIADLLIGDPTNHRFFLVFGSTSALGRDLLLDGPADGRSVLRHESIPWYFGRLQAPAGDVDGDGLDDLLVGVSTSTTTMVYLLLGTPTWFDELYVDKVAAIQIDTGSRFSTFAGVGDVNDDENDDLAVTSGTTVYLFLGHGDLASSPPNPTALDLADADATFSSATSDPQVVALGDVDGDGMSDFIYQSGNAPQLVLGDSGGAWATHSFDNLDPPASGFLAAPGDVDGDGLADLLLGNSHGDAYLILGSELDAVQATLTGVDGAASAPYTAGSDLNSDGSSDLLLLPDADSGSGLGLASVDLGELAFTAPQDLPTQYARRVLSDRNTEIERSGDREIGEGRQVEAATRYVNDDAGCEGFAPCYSTIQAAVDAAANGDIIIVQPGAYDSFLVDGVNDLTLSGTYADAVFVDGAGGPYAAKIQNATGVILEKMTLRDAQNAIVLQDAGLNGYDNPSLITNLQSLLIYDFSEHALSMNRASNARLSQCTLASGKNHIEVTGSPDPDSDPAWDATLSTTGMPTSSDGGGLTSDGGLVYLAPGSGSNTFSAYDPGADAWSARANVPIQMTSGASNPAADGNGSIYLLPGSIWEAMGSGLGSGSTVSDSLTLGSDLYLAGDFTQAGGVSVAHLARWDGSAWYDVGGGVSKAGGGAYLTSLAADSSGNVYVAGDFDQAGGVSASGVAYWDGGAWHAVGSLPAVPTAVALDGNGVLYAGSCALGSGGVSGGSDNLWQWDGGSWVSVTSRCIHDLAASRGEDHNMFMTTDTGVRRYSTSWGWRDWDSFFSGPVYTVLPLDDSNFYAGGDFTASEDGVTSDNIAHIEYTCPGGMCSYNVIAIDGGVNGIVRALAGDGGNLYAGGEFSQAGGLSASRVARWDGSAWHTLAHGSSDGANASVTALSRYESYVYAGGEFSQAGGVSASRVARWSHPLYRHDIAGNSWSALAPIPQAIGGGCALAADGEGHVYALPGSDSIAFFQYDVAGGTWTRKASLPAVAKAGGALALAHGYIYALRGSESRSFYRYDPAANSWSTMASIPDTSGVAAAGADLAWDGHEWLYGVLGGNGRHFLRYRIALDQWEVLGDGSSGTSDDDDTPTVVSEGGALGALDDGLYGIPGGGAADLWRFAPIAVYREKLQLDRVAFVVQETATQGDWYNLPLDGDMPEDFAVAGGDNVWVGGSATAWNPDPTVWPESRLNLGTLDTHDQAAFLDPDRYLYRLTAASTLAAGYTAYQPDVNVPGDYASIQDAVLSGANRITVDAGSYAQAFYLVGGVEVVGARADRTVLSPPGGHSGPLVSAEGLVGATLTGFTLDGDDSFPGFRAEGGTEHLTLTRSILRDTTTAIELDGAGTQLEVVNNTVIQNDDGLVASSGSLVDVRNTIFAYNSGTGLDMSGAGGNPLHTYNLYWANGTDLNPNEPGPAEIFLDPRFVDPLNDNYYTDDYSPVIDAGNPTDPHPPGTGENVDIGYIEQGRAAYYVDDDYCADCLNDGLTWGVDAFDQIQPALDEAHDEQVSFGNETAGDVTCRILRSDDVPLDISASGTDEVISALDVAQRGLVTDVNVHSLRGTHGRVSDLDFVLESPSGTMVRLLTPLTCDQADFDLHLDDEATPGSPPCPPNDGGTYQPVQSLSKLDGDNSEGPWLLHVRDSADGEGGALDAWGLEICARDLPPLLTVGVGPGTYPEMVSVPSYVRLVGIGPDQATVDASGLGTPVTFDGVVHAGVSGLTLYGDGSNAGVLVGGGSNHVLIDRNLIQNDRRGLVFESGATGTATFNTLVGQSTSPSDAYGIQANGTGSQVVAENNIVHNYRYGLYLQSDGNIYSDYNLLAGNTDNYGSGMFHGQHDLQRSSPGFVGGGDYHLDASSPAVDNASPHEPVPAGGGTRADIGYHELIALPATLFLGREGISTAIGNSGLARVESAVVPVADLYSAASETTPATWDTVYDDPAHEQTKATWLLSDTPGAEGLHRAYSRAEDAVGNTPGDGVDWYVGAFVADGSASTVTWLAPVPGSVSTLVELRAQAWDEAVGQFSVETVQFEVDSDVVPAQWAAEPWDPASDLPRVFRAWASLSLGTNPTVVAVAYDRAGNRGESAPVVLNVTSSAAADTTAPSLTIASPTAGGLVQPPVLFQGTASDTGGSGLAAVQVSLDNGVTWLPAAVSGSDWSLSWNPPWQQDYVTHPTLVRARDKVGNATTQAVTFAVDNVPPTLNTAIANGRNRFYDITPPNNDRYIYPGQHLDYPTQFKIYVGWPWDGSDPDGSSLTYQYIVDQNADTQPILAGPWNTKPTDSPEEWFTLPDEWYVHIYYRDLAGNIAVHHYGPWHMGNFGDTLTQCNDRRQSIELDGLVDVANGEWADHEFLDDDERGMDLGYERQSLYAAWDGEAFYAAWQGAWWDVDGTMWVYLDVQDSGGDSGLNHTVTYPYKTLPILANYAIRVDGQGSATRYWSWGGSWQSTSVEFAHGDSGGTEVRFPWEMSLDNVMDARMLAYAEDNDGQVWSVFPTTNSLDGTWSDYYHWNTLCNILYGVNANQPSYASLLLDIVSEVAPDAPQGPGVDLTYNLQLTNMEDVTTTISTLVISATDALGFGMQEGGTCDTCPPWGNEWILLVPPIAPGVTYNITLTGQLSDTLTGLSEFTISGTLGFGGQTWSQASITQQLDSLPPTLEVEFGPNQTVCTGPQTIRGSACDQANPERTSCVGGGVDLVQYSVNGGVSWQDAEGTNHWSATVDVPTGSPTYDLWVQAIDVFGQATQELFTFNLDASPPTVTLDLPAYLTGSYTRLGGTATDGESAVVSVDMQMDTDTSAWNAGQVYPPDGGSQKWQYTQVLPSVDGENHQFRARATDAGCNASTPTDWQTARIDNVAPQLVVTDSLDAVIGLGYPAGGSAEPVLQGIVADGSGVTNVQVQVIDTMGAAEWRPATLDGDGWAFRPEFTPVVTGAYRLRVQATDVAGNVRTSAAHDLYVCETVGCLIEHTRPTHHAWVPAGAYTETVEMDKPITLTLESDVRLSGTLTLSDGLWVAPSGVMTLTGDFDLTGGTFQHNDGTLVFDGGSSQALSGSATFHNLKAERGSTLVVVDGLVVEDTLTNNGTLQQTQVVNGSADVSFFNTGGYGGLVLNTNGSDLGSTVVKIRGNDENCTIVAGETVKRCFNISPANSTGRNASISFYFAASELSGNACDMLEAYRAFGNSWVELTRDPSWWGDGRGCPSDGIGEPYVMRVKDVSDFSSFVLKSSGPPASDPAEVILTPDRSTSADPGVSVTYIHTMTNAHGNPVTFDISHASSQNWAVIYDTPIAVDGWQTATVVVSVTVPADAISGTVDTMIITATSQADASVVNAVIDTTTVKLMRGVDLTPDRVGSAAPDKTVVYAHTLFNNGNYTDTFDINHSGDQAWITDYDTPITLDAWQTTTMVVSVTVPAGVSEGIVDTTVLTATSQADGGIFATVTDTTNVVTSQWRVFLPIIRKNR